MDTTTVAYVDIATGPVVAKGNSRYVLAPPDWPQGAKVRLLLLPQAEATPQPNPPPDYGANGAPIPARTHAQHHRPDTGITIGLI